MAGRGCQPIRNPGICGHFYNRLALIQSISSGIHILYERLFDDSGHRWLFRRCYRRSPGSGLQNRLTHPLWRTGQFGRKFLLYVKFYIDLLLLDGGARLVRQSGLWLGSAIPGVRR